MAMRVALEEGGVSFFDDHKESGIKAAHSTGIAGADIK
jgi:hypothetical protein